MKLKKQLLTGALLASLVLASLTAGCKKANPEPGYNKAFYSAQAVYGVDALGDLFEIFKNGGVLTASSGHKAITVTEQGLTALDEVTNLLEKGLPVSSFDKIRATIAAVKAAVANGAIQFTSDSAAGIYADVVATLEITINLIEAIRDNNQQRVTELEKERASRAKAMAARKIIRGQTIPWYQEAIVRATKLVTDIATLSPQSGDAIWLAVHARSADAHAKDKARLAKW